ncbi:MAG: R3H domain-containing nucleic acid-binding protein [Candidatus Paceibacterota bacterium]
MYNKTQESIKQTLIDLLEAMGMEASIDEERIETIKDGKEIFTLNLKTEFPNLLIGQYGGNLQCLQHLVGVIVKHKLLAEEGEDVNLDEEVKFNIDVNDYKKQKKETLVKLAETMADQVVYSKNSVALRPMSPYERKVIHLELADRKNLVTESVGENLMRRVIIKYVDGE